MKIGLASPRIPQSINDGLDLVEKLTQEAAREQAAIICFPESFLPGYPGMGYKEEERSPERLQAALEKVKKIAAENSIGIILPMDWPHPDGFLRMHLMGKKESSL